MTENINQIERLTTIITYQGQCSLLEKNRRWIFLIDDRLSKSNEVLC
ncbi:hypothetical protein T11_14317 [Trichinella zimbabwensis]|uniref:Uncharacterized protein n=1 Tax=Trichinella zimbabwensis TaxID=268475 RepID=A0A0V1GNJ8_9BILA|nr:hypothetical protein T11_14317 [Trichinella zimbabwensis]